MCAADYDVGKQTFSNTMMSSSSTSISAAAVPVLFCRNLSTLARTGSCSITQRIGIHRGQAAAAFHSLHNVMTCRSGKYCVQNEFLNSCARKALRMTRIMASQEGEGWSNKFSGRLLYSCIGRMWWIPVLNFLFVICLCMLDCLAFCQLTRGIFVDTGAGFVSLSFMNILGGDFALDLRTVLLHHLKPLLELECFYVIQSL